MTREELRGQVRQIALLAPEVGTAILREMDLLDELYEAGRVFCHVFAPIERKMIGENTTMNLESLQKTLKKIESARGK